eukprot:scaffold871_cov130-Cylindrotheca_fusiformis.AAC.20
MVGSQDAGLNLVTRVVGSYTCSTLLHISGGRLELLGSESHSSLVSGYRRIPSSDRIGVCYCEQERLVRDDFITR